MAFPTPSINNFYGTLATDLIMSLLTGGDDGLLLEQWKKDGIPVIDFGAEFVSSRAPGRLLIWAITEPGQARRLCRSTMNLLASLAAKPAPAETLALAKGRLAAELLMGNETYSQQAATLAFYEGLNGADALSRYIPAVEELTTEQVRVAMPTRLLAWITQGSRPE